MPGHRKSKTHASQPAVVVLVVRLHGPLPQASARGVPQGGLPCGPVDVLLPPPAAAARLLQVPRHIGGLEHCGAPVGVLRCRVRPCGCGGGGGFVGQISNKKSKKIK